jgi:hypothetical protein
LIEKLHALLMGVHFIFLLPAERLVTGAMFTCREVVHLPHLQQASWLKSLFWVE